MNWDTFAGMVPADDPQFVVAIMVDNPAHGLEGGDVAAPVFKHDRELRTAARPHRADRVAVQARAAVGVRRGHPPLGTKYRLLTCRLLRFRSSRCPGLSRSRPSR